MTDTITFWVWVGIWPLWLVVELVILWQRGQRIRVATISMIARDRAWQLNTAPYLWAGMGTHWWAPGTWATVATSVAFWALALLLLAWDVFILLASPDRHDWPPWLRRVRTPAVWLLLGALGGWLLFPQHDAFFWATWGGR